MLEEKLKTPSIQKNIVDFKRYIWDFYQEHGRSFAWRNVDNPYYVFVSEIMLQQTQTYRVEPKFDFFIQRFPSFGDLAAASLYDVLTVWQGLGYNRRAKYMHQAANIIINTYDGKLPDDPALLVLLPGIGPATAASITAFAYNKPTVFIETNIRSVFIHSFFKKEEDIADKDLLPLIEQTLDHDNPREWYYALMDYGVYLKKQVINPSRKSKHYVKQSRFEGSDRQLRGRIIKILLAEKAISKENLLLLLRNKPEKIECIVRDLITEDFITHRNDMLCIR